MAAEIQNGRHVTDISEESRIYYLLKHLPRTNLYYVLGGGKLISEVVFHI